MLRLTAGCIERWAVASQSTGGKVRAAKYRWRMTADEFRELALAHAGASESSHMRHPDFRFRTKIFATLSPDNQRGMVKLTWEQQAAFVKLAPKTFSPANGAWGRQGCTMVVLSGARKSLVSAALEAAWELATMAADSRPALKKAPRRRPVGDTKSAAKSNKKGRAQ